jgi:ABC-type Fe3+ transport system permease subunit/sugar lactone lactonase YvrE
MNWPLFQNSLLVSGGATLLALALGLTVALWATALPARGRNWVLALAVVALALPPFLVTNCWLHYLGGAGAWRGWLPVDLLSLPGAAWLLALLYWPVTTLLVGAAWQRLEPALLEVEPAARGWALVRFILLPLARPALVQSALLTFVLALNNFTVPAILQVKVFPAEVWVKFSTELLPGDAFQLGWPLIVAPLLLLGWLARRGCAWPSLSGGLEARGFRRQLGAAWFRVCGAVNVSVLTLAVVLPLSQITLATRTWVDFPLALTAGQAALWSSFWSAAITATLVVGLAVVLNLRRRWPFGFRFSALLRLSTFGFRTSLWLPFLVPGVLLGVALIVLFNRPEFFWLYRGAGIVLLALAVRYFALGWTGVRHALDGTDSELNDVARMEGASRWQTLRWVLWPQIAPQVAAAWYVVYVLCLWDVESLVLIVPPGGETLALRVFNLLHYGHNAQVNALCLMLLALALAPLLAWVAARFFRSRGRVAGAVGALAATLLAGCGGGNSDTERRLESALFERAVVLNTRGTAPGQFNKPRSVTVDRNDDFYVADMTGRVQKLAPDGRFLRQWQMPVTDLGKPKGLCLDLDGNVVVVEPHYQRVNHFTTNGALVAQWGAKGTNAGLLRLPRAVAMNSHGEFYLPEYSVVERVQRFAGTNGVFLNGFGRAGTGPGEFNRPEGIAVDAQDRVYVADSCNHRIQVFDRAGKFLRQFGKPGRGAGELSYPYDVCVDAAGRVYVCEFGNSRLQVFGPDGRSLEIIGGPGAEPGRFNNPWGLALDAHGNLYVADALNHRVQKLLRRAVR